MQPHNLTRDEARRRALLLSDLRYDIALDLTQGDQTFTADATIRFRCAEPGATTFVDLWAPGVERASLNGRNLPAEAFDGTRIVLDRLAAENEVHIVARCAYQHSGAGLHHFTDPVDGNVYLHTQFEPRDAHRIYPCFDQPDCKGTFTLSVNARSGWEVVSNSRVVERPQGGGGWWRFETTKPLPTYITAVVAGPYHQVHRMHRDIDLGIYCRRSLAQYLDPDEIFDVTQQGFDFFERAFDYPYVFGKYDQLFVPEFSSGAMENAGCVTFHESYIFRSRVTEAAREGRATTVLHELAHMWFGDLVTMRWWDDLWLNESFATFVSTLALVDATRFRQGWTTFAVEEKTWAYKEDQLPSTHPIVADCVDVETAILNFDGVTYAKGASVLRQLVAWVGEDAFLEGCRRYFRRYEYGNAELGDFLSALEETSGRDLKAWSKEWLETAGVNTIRPELEVAGGAYKRVRLKQEAPAEWPVLRPHRLGVGLYDLRDDRLGLRRRVELDLVGAHTDVPALSGEPAADLLLVNDGDLTFAKIRFDEGSLATAAGALGTLEDSLARALVWGSAWDMLRDGELAARDYRRLVLSNVGDESDIGVMQSLLGQIRGATVIYGHPSRRDAALREIAEAAERALQSSEPSSDRQVAWARALVGTASDPEHVALIRGLLDGTVTVDGLAVDFDLRWSIVTRLAIAGAADDRLIAAEVERDPTDEGRRNAARAGAARPDAASKAAAWEAVTREAEMPLALVRATMSGFGQWEQADLLAPWTRAFFDTIEPVLDMRTRDVAFEIIEGLYPEWEVSEETLRLTDEYLTTTSPIPPVRRILLEGRDSVARVLRARARDA